MNKATYKNNNQSYPISTDSFDFMQQQIMLVHNIAKLGGVNYILSQPTPSSDGIIVINTEMLPLKYNANAASLARIEIVEESVSIEAQNNTYPQARIIRYAQYCATSLRDNILVTSLQTWSPLAELAKHTVQKRSINWFYITDLADLPEGYIPCVDFVYAVGNSGTRFPNEPLRSWLNSLSIPYDTTPQWNPSRLGEYGGYYYAIYFAGRTVNGVAIPNLTEKFIVGAGIASGYDVGDTGGSNSVTLTINQMPQHSHDLFLVNSGTRFTGSGYANALNTGAGTTGQTGGNKPHENRPPYMALLPCIKVI